MLARMIVVIWLLIAETVSVGQATAVDLNDFQLRPVSNQAELLNIVEKLDLELPKLGVKNILDQANRIGTLSTTPKTCNPHATLNRNLTTVSYCFSQADSGTIGGDVEWMPQGVTTVADAMENQLWNTKQPILISWYDKKSDKVTNTDADKIKGARVTFFDPVTVNYQHVLLVYPLINSFGNPSYMSLRTTQKNEYDSLHAGGIAWYGNYLYVADTGHGFRVFDMRYIFDLKTAANGDTSDKNQIGRQNGKYYGHGYRYVMPQVDEWTNVVERDVTKKCTDNAGSPTFSFVAVDRSGVDHLISGEFCADKAAAGDINKSGRVARWPLDGNTGQPKLTNGLWKADAAYRLPISNIQGAVSYNNKWYLSRSQGSSNGFLYVTKSIISPTGILEIDTAHFAAVGPEDLSHWTNPDGSAGGLWTVTEHAGKRLLYACDIDQLNNREGSNRICGPRANLS
ncbi:unnamed protein product [Rotaria sp. Silwood2]|nr:unnamed protein product [Rotaria sp. Silwood2]CAF2817092.1 unnamed protein product [Rotaria sp. Silwood2]CAF3111204.1 unnamed protein product [Rotaria sp. Silwood2]CAF3240173.1 unnamed protein product [Rotaria sp. Silwood2]CAF3950190.1 unnamed protein product [Rotaria sp. Silwood2]